MAVTRGDGRRLPAENFVGGEELGDETWSASFLATRGVKRGRGGQLLGLGSWPAASLAMGAHRSLTNWRLR